MRPAPLTLNRKRRVKVIIDEDALEGLITCGPKLAGHLAEAIADHPWWNPFPPKVYLVRIGSYPPPDSNGNRGGAENVERQPENAHSEDVADDFCRGREKSGPQRMVNPASDANATESGSNDCAILPVSCNTAEQGGRRDASQPVPPVQVLADSGDRHRNFIRSRGHAQVHQTRAEIDRHARDASRQILSERPALGEFVAGCGA